MFSVPFHPLDENLNRDCSFFFEVIVTMKTNLILSIFLGMAFSGCMSINSQNAIVPSKNYITQKVQVGKFDGISTSTSIDVIYTQTTGNTDVEIYAPDNLMNYVKVEVDGEMLKIGFDSGEKGRGLNINGKHETEVRISAPAVHLLRASSSGDIILKNGLQTTGKVDVASSSSGDIKGRDIVCDVLDAEASSSGDIDLDKVECTSLMLESSSAGDVSIKVLKAETVHAEASSSGDVSLEGICRSAKFEASSAGDIEADELKADEVVAKASSAGDITCHVLESLDASTSSKGNVRYKGNPKQIKNNSKGLQKMD